MGAAFLTTILAILILLSYKLGSLTLVLNRCSTTVESFPSGPTDQVVQSDIQKIRVLVGRPLRRPPKHQITTESLISAFPAIDLNPVDQNISQNLQAFNLGKFLSPEGLSDFVVFCTTDFSTISKEVHVRTRRVRLVGLEVLLSKIVLSF